MYAHIHTLVALGRFVATRLKRGALFSSALERLGNADRRMQHELNMQLSQADVRDRLSGMRLRTPPARRRPRAHNSNSSSNSGRRSVHQLWHVSGRSSS